MGDMPHLNMEALASALRAGDIRVLLMVLVHLTGDRAWLSAPYRPKRDVRIVPDPSAGIAPSAQEQVRAAVLQRLLSGEPPAITDPGDELIVEMMSACLAEDVPPEYARLTREEMGFVSRDVAWSQDSAAVRERAPTVLIVGAGVSGIALAVRLDRLGIRYTIVERNQDIGGTWYENRYPGCGVDTPNHSYSFSFGERYAWSRYFSPREEIQDYLLRIVEEFGLRERIRFGTRLVGAEWSEGRNVWTARVTDERGVTESLEAQVLVTAVGHFGQPIVPPVEGRDLFKGKQLHSGQWPAEIDLRGARLAVIGTGASAMQIVPMVADSVRSLTIYQRSPQWVRPIARYSDPIGAETQWLLREVPFYAGWFRFTMFWRYGDGLLPFLRKDPAWPHPERSINRGNDRHREELTQHIRSELRERPDLIERCTPTYPPYGKRILLDNGWYKALLKPNVELVTGEVVRLHEDGVEARDGSRRAADVVIWATGFDLGELAARLNIVGEHGRTLAEAWEERGPAAYLGMMVPGFPNFFSLLGPNSGLGHGGSTIFQAECQARYISSALVAMAERDLAAITVQEEVFEHFVQKVDQEHEGMIWTHPGMTTYYRNKKGRVTTVTPWRLADNWAMTHDIDLGDFRISPTAERERQPHPPQYNGAPEKPRGSP